MYRAVILRQHGDLDVVVLNRIGGRKVATRVAQAVAVQWFEAVPAKERLAKVALRVCKRRELTTSAEGPWVVALVHGHGPSRGVGKTTVG